MVNLQEEIVAHNHANQRLRQGRQHTLTCNTLNVKSKSIVFQLMIMCARDSGLKGHPFVRFAVGTGLDSSCNAVPVLVICPQEMNFQDVKDTHEVSGILEGAIAQISCARASTEEPKESGRLPASVLRLGDKRLFGQNHYQRGFSHVFRGKNSRAQFRSDCYRHPKTDGRFT
jgi:hypothetical protein